MAKIRKYQMFAFLEVFEIKGCKTIEDIKDVLNKELKQDTDVVFQWGANTTKKDFQIPKCAREVMLNGKEKF